MRLLWLGLLRALGALFRVSILSAAVCFFFLLSGYHTKIYGHYSAESLAPFVLGGLALFALILAVRREGRLAAKDETTKRKATVRGTPDGKE